MTDYQPDSIHDRRHVLPTHQYARESLVYNAHLPGECVLTVYLWVNGQGKAGYAAGIFGPAAGSKAIFETLDDVVMPAEADFLDWNVGGLHVSQTPLGSATVSLAGERLTLEYEFAPMHPAFAYDKSYDERSDGCPPFLADRRMEQSGFVKGVLTIDGRELPFDGLGHRDHSTGHRDWEMMQSYRWIEAQAEDVAVNVLTIAAQGRVWDLGYVYRDGEVSAIRSVDFDVDYDDRWVQDGIAVSIVDALGRLTEVTSTRFGRHEYPVGADTKLVDTAIEVDIEGRKGLGYSDWGWPRDYLRHLREHAVGQLKA